MLIGNHFLVFAYNFGFAKRVISNTVENYDDVDGLYFVFLSYPLLQTPNVHHRVHSHLEYLLSLLIINRQYILHILPRSPVSPRGWRYVLRHFSFPRGHRVIVNCLHILIKIIIQIISAVVTVHHLSEEFV